MVISESIIKKTQMIFSIAQKDGRNVLYEHEVYGVLNILGIDTPKYIFVGGASDVNESILSEFGKEIVIKVVSKDIAHKQKVGGVKKVLAYDEFFVRYVIDSMKKEVLSNYKDKEPDISGFIIVEAIEFTQTLGAEILMGISMDRDFGPVLTLSKGGDDAEFFAKYFDPANISLPIHNKEQALELAHSMKISKKYENIGHGEYINMIADVVYSLSKFAYAFSKLNKCETKYYIKSMDINPFVFTKDNRFVAIDGYAEFELCSKKPIREINVDGLDKVFKPKGIAILGVSTDVSKQSLATEILKLIMEFDRDDIYCINPKGGSIFVKDKEFKLYRSIEDLPCEVDMAVYAAPAKHIPFFFGDLKTKKPKSVILIPGIPSGMKYREFEKKLDEVVDKDIRIVGPNCMGVFYAPDKKGEGINTLFLDEERFKVNYGEFSNVAMLTQSGGLSVTLVDKFSHTPVFKSIVSFGNKYDITLADLLGYFEKQDEVYVISMYLEGFEPMEGRMFFELAKQANKPLVLYKGGRTEEGAKAALSHTAAMTGNYEVLEAACEQADVVLLEDVETYAEVVKGFALLAKRKFTGMNVAAISNAGFETTMFSDQLGSMNIANLSKDTLKELDEINTHRLASVKTAVLDVTPMTDDVMYGKFIEALLKDDGVDAVMVSVMPHVDAVKGLAPECYDCDSVANIICDLYEKYNKPMVVSVDAGDFYKEFISVLEKKGIAVYDNVKSAAKVLDVVSSWHNKKRKSTK